MPFLMQVINFLLLRKGNHIRIRKNIHSTTGIILRKCRIRATRDELFGEMSFDIDDLMRIDENGKGYVNILLNRYSR
jgi:hypothetical protein